MIYANAADIFVTEEKNLRKKFYSYKKEQEQSQEPILNFNSGLKICSWMDFQSILEKI